MEKSTACSSTALVDSPMSKKPVLTRQHTLEAAQSVVMEAQPTAFVSQPTTTISQPATTLSQPTTSISQPSTTISQPTSSLSQLSTSVPQPISSISQPSTTISQATTFITQAQPVISKLDTPLVISVPVTAAVCHSNNISPAPSRDEDSQPPIEELLIKQSSTDSGIGEGKKKKGAAKQGKYPCRFCDHTCNKPSVLEKHLRTHTGERPYPCDVCNQSFKTNSNLYKHRKTQGHMLKCKERGISLDESRDESCGSSRDETSFDVDYNMDIEEDRHSVSENNTQISPRPAKEPSSKQIDALKQLESLCNLLDSDTKWSDYTLTNRFESMSDKTTKITLSLIKTKVIPTPKLGTLRLFPLPPVRSNSVPVTERGENSSKVEARIDNIIQSNEKIVGPRVPPPRRLSRQNSVTSPTAHMFASASSVEEVFSPVIPEADFPLETNNIEQSINDLLEKSREELTFVENALSLIQVDQKESALDIHLKLPSADSNTQTASMKRSGYSAHKYSLVCSLCGAVFGRADIFDIHKRFYCIKKSSGRVLSKAKSEDHVTHHPPSLTDRPKLLHSTSEMPLSNITEYRPPSAPRTSTPKECLKNHLLTKQKSSSYSTDVPTIITNSSPLQCTGSVVNLAPKPMRHSPINIPTVTKPIIMSPVILSSPGVIPAFRPLFTAVQQIPPNPAFIPTSAMVVSPPLARTPSTELPRQSSFNKTISPLVASPLLTSAGYSPRFIRSPLIMNSQSFSPGAHQTVVQTTPINTKQSTLIPRPKSIDPTSSPPVTSGGGTTTKLIERRPFIPTSRSTSVKEKPTPKQNKMSGHSFDSQTSSTTIKLQIPLKRVAPTSDLPIPPSKIINIPTSAPNKIQQHEPTNLLINTKAGANSRKPSTNQLFAAASTNQMISPLYPITYHALLPHFDGDYIVEWRKKLKNEGVASMFEFQSTDCCSCHRIIPATQPHPPKYSSYSQWVTAPRSNYNPVDALNSYCSSSHHSTQYSICKGDTRCSPTHSAYWKLARGLKDTSGTSLPISRIHSQPTAKIEQTTNDIKPLVKGPSYKAPSSAAKFTWPTTVVQTVLQPKAKPVESTVKSCHASVIVAPRDAGSKQLNRSQSTPSSAAQQTTAEIKQKFVTGGFKSEDEYVYVRGRGRGKYVCQQCGIRCKKPSMLKKHIRTHTDLRPYSCGHCTFSFKTKGNLTKHMKSKAHHRRCLELGIYPVPTAVDDTQIDENVLATQQKISRESKIMGKCDNSEDGSSDDDDSDTDDTSDGEDNSNTSDDDTGNLQIDEGETTPEKDEKEDKQELTEPLMNPAVLRRVQSMPANRKQNSLDQSNETIAENTENDHKFITPPPKKRRKLSKLASGDSKDSTSNSFGQRSSMEEELARSLLALSTPVHRNSVEQPIAPKPEQPEKMLQSQHVSVVRGPQNNNSTVRNIASKPKLMMDNLNEPIDLSNKGETIPNLENMFICHLCRAIHETQDSLNQHMGKHKLNSKASSKLKRSFSTHLEKQSSADSNKSVPSSPSLGQLKRQFAFSQTIKDDGEIEQGEVTSSEESSDSPRKNQEKNKLKTICPFCQKVFQRTNYLTDHVTRHHPEQLDTFMVQFTSQDEHSNLSQTSPDKNTQPIPCQVCDRVFKNTSGLKQHLVSHAELRPYICEYCDAGFTTAMHLKNHLKTHTQERPYICGECGSTFARPDHLKQHSKTHRKQTFENSS